MGISRRLFLHRLGATGGYGVPADIVRKALRGAKKPVSTGECAP